jgi:sulfoquinovosyltransferase
MHCLEHGNRVQWGGLAQRPRAHVSTSLHRAKLQQLQRLDRATASSASSTAAESASAPPATYTPRKVALFVEPSPFSHISGMKNRFESLIKNLREAGDEVIVVTPDANPPKEFCGAQVG